MVKSPLKGESGLTPNASAKVLDGCKDPRSPLALLTKLLSSLTHQKQTRNLSSLTSGQMTFTDLGGRLSTNGVATDGHSTMGFSMQWTNSSHVSLSVFAKIPHYETTQLLRYAQTTATNQGQGPQDRSVGLKPGCMRVESDHLLSFGPRGSSPPIKKAPLIMTRFFRLSI